MFGFVAVGADCDVGIGAAASLGLQRGVLPLAAALKQDLVAGNIGVLIHAGDGLPCGLFGFAVFAVVAVGADVVSGSCGVRRKGVGVAGSYGNGLDVECAAVPAVGVELDFCRLSVAVRALALRRDITPSTDTRKVSLCISMSMRTVCQVSVVSVPASVVFLPFTWDWYLQRCRW